MTPERALEIVTKLAEGVDPYTGERLPAWASGVSP